MLLQPYVKILRMEQVTICIPTYGKRIRNQLIVKRTLDSFMKLPKAQFRVIVFNTTEPLDEKVNFSISKLVSQFRESFPIMLVTSLDLEHLRNYLVEHGFNGITTNLNFKGYSNMRNSMLVVANILKSKIVLMIDDDEIVNTRNFIPTAVEFIGSKYRKKKLFGKTGYYKYKNTGYRLTQQSPKTRKLWLKETYINEALEKSIKSRQRLNETTMAFCGIMVLHSHLYRKIPFDPNISRGEDTDYLMNAKQFGFNFVLDKNLSILHSPAKKPIRYWEKHRQDIYRFIYVREKLKYFNKIELKSLEPYPAVFLKDDLEYRAVLTSVYYARRWLKKKRYDYYKEHFKNAKIAFTEAKMNAVINAPKYFELQKNWAKFMHEVPKFRELFKHFNRF